MASLAAAVAEIEDARSRLEGLPAGDVRAAVLASLRATEDAKLTGPAGALLKRLLREWSATT